MDDERRRQELGKEDDGDSFGANPVDSLRGEGDLTVAKLLDMVVSRREAGGREARGCALDGGGGGAGACVRAFI